MDIGTLTGHIEIEDEISNRLDIIADTVGDFAKEFDGAMGAVAKSVGVAVVAIGTMTATIIALGNTGSEVNDITDTFEKFAGSAGNAAEMLGKMREGTKGVVTDFNLMKDANRLLAAGIQVTADEMGTLARTASVLADQGLGSVEENMKMLNQAMLTGRTRAVELKLGKIDLKKAEDEFAKSLGTTRDRLNEEGKAQAHRIALIEVANKRNIEAGEIQKSFADIMTGSIVKIKNWGNELAGAVAKSPAVMGALRSIGAAISETFGTTGDTIQQSLLKGIEAFANEAAKYGPIIVKFLGEVRDTAVEYWPYVVEFFSKIKDAAMDLWDWLKEINERYHITETVVEVATKAWEFLSEAIHLVEHAIELLRDAWESMPEWLKEIAVSATVAGVGLTIASKSMEHAAEEASGFGHAAEKGVEGIHEYGAAIYYLNDAIKILSGEKLSLTKMFESLGEYLLNIKKAFIFAGETIAEVGLGGLIANEMTVAGAALDGMLTTVIGWGIAVAEAIGLVVSALFTIPGAVVAALVALRLLTGSWDFILDPLAALWQLLKDVTVVITDLTKIAIHGLIEGAKWLWDAFTDLVGIFTTAVSDLSDLLGIGDAVSGFFISLRDDIKATVNEGSPLLVLLEGLHNWAESIRAKHAAEAEDARKKEELAALAHFKVMQGMVGEVQIIGAAKFEEGGGIRGGFAGGKILGLETGEDSKKYVQSLQERVDKLLESLRKAPEEMQIFQAAFKQLTPRDFAMPELVAQLIPKIDALAEATGGHLDPAMKRVYESFRLNQQAMADEGFNVLALRDVTLEQIEALRKQGLSEAQIARHYDVTIKALKDYTQVKQEHRKATDELTKSQDALNEAQRAYDLKGAKITADAAQLALQQQFDSGLIAAENYNKKRIAIDEDYNATRLRMEQDRVDDAEAIAIRELDQQIARGEKNEADYGALITALHAKFAQQRLDVDQMETDRRLKLTSEGYNQAIQMVKQYNQEAFKNTHTDTEVAIADINRWASETKAAYKGSAAFAQMYYDFIDKLADERRRNEYVDRQALRSNTIAALDAIRDKAWSTYKEMAKDPEHYAVETRAQFHKIALDASDAAKHVQHEWRTAFESIPETLKSAFEGGGDLEGALKSLAITFSELFAKEMAKNIATQIEQTTQIITDRILVKGKAGLTGKLAGLAIGGGALTGIAAAASGAPTGQQLGMAAMGAASTGMTVAATAGVGLGVALGAITFGASAAVIGIAALIKHLHAARNEAVKFATESYGGFDNLRKEMLKLGDQGEIMWKQLTQGDLSKKQVQALGEQIKKSLAEVEADVEKYGLSWDDVTDAQTKAAKSAKDLEASYRRLTAAGFSSDKVLDAMSKDLNQLIIDSVKAGTKIPESMRPILESLIKQKKLSQEAANALLGIADAGVPSLDSIREAADRYGISLDALGPKVAQLEINEAAETMVDDWKTLTSVTDDWTAIIEGMAPKVQDLVDKALKFGIELPASMKPMIEAMIKAGKLVDENGDALTDLAQLPWAADLSEMFETLMTKLDELIDKIANGVGGALDEVGNRTVHPKIQPEYEEPTGAPSIRNPSGPIIIRDSEGNVIAESPGSTGTTSGRYYAIGGVVQPETPVYAQTGKLLQFAPKRPVPQGTDTVNTMLTPKEGVVNVRGMETLTPQGLGILNEKPGEFYDWAAQQKQGSEEEQGKGGAIIINVNIDKPVLDSSQRVDEIVDKLGKKLPRMLRQGGQTLDDWAQVHRILKRKVG